MYVDNDLLFSDAQAITASAASTNLIDLSVAQRRPGVGKPLYYVVACVVAMTDAGSDSTVAVTVEQDTLAAFGSATTVQTLGTFAATSAAGTNLVVALDWNVITEEFIRLYYTVANGNLTTGSFDAFITDTPQAYYEHADNLTITNGAL